MATIFKPHLLLLAFVLPLASASISPAPSPQPSKQYQITQASIDLIKNTCELTPHKEDCISALNNEPLAHQAQPKQLAAIILRLAQQNATETAGYITGLLDQTDTEPNTQQCLTDCVEDYELALAELDDAAAALDDNLYHATTLNDAVTWIETAISQVKTCQDGCKEGAEHKNVMTKRNGAFSKLCSISISIIKSLNK